MDLKLDGKVALVGGASQGIGEASARLLAERGAKVILMARRPDVIESVRASLPNPALHTCLAIDLERTEELGLYLSRLVHEAGPVAIWINNMGGPKAGPLHEATPAEMERAFRGHVLASQVILKVLLPGMKSLQYGRIINVLSTSVKIPIPNLGVSNIIRAGMASWAKTLSQELGPFGITVNNVLPGYTETPRLSAVAADAAQRSGVSEESVRRAWIDSTPLRRLGDPAETAEAIAFLASAGAGYISGVSLPVDGGRTGAF